MKKLFIAIMVAVTVLAGVLMAACGGIDEAPSHELDEELEAQIAQDFREQFESDFNYDLFYGFYSDCAAFFFATSGITLLACLLK